MKVKKIETNLLDMIRQEISGRKCGHNGNGKKRLEIANKNIDYINSKEDFHYLDAHNKKIYQGYKQLTNEDDL